MGQPDLRKLSDQHRDKLSKIKLFLTDVDGVLTDGRIFWASDEVGFNRFFHTHDGYGLKVLIQSGIEVGVISGGESTGLQKRLEGLGIPHIELGKIDKREGFKKILEKTGVSPEETLYIGDEFFDLPILEQVGFSVSVPSASHEVQEAVDYVTHRESGMGCVREVIDMLRYAQNITPKVERD